MIRKNASVLRYTCIACIVKIIFLFNSYTAVPIFAPRPWEKFRQTAHRISGVLTDIRNGNLPDTNLVRYH